MTSTSDEASRLIDDPATPASTLAEIAAQHRELHARIVAHPNAYPALVDWIAEWGGTIAPAPASAAVDSAPVTTARPDASPTTPAAVPPVAPSTPWLAVQWRDHRSRSITAMALAALLVIGGATAVAVAATPRPAPSIEAVPSATTTPQPTPTPSPTPSAPPTLQLGPGQLGSPFGEAIVTDSRGMKGPTLSAPATLYFPGEGSTTYNATDFVIGEDVLDQSLTLIGSGADLRVAMVVKIRKPAAGLDPESYRFDLVSLDRTGTVIRQTTVVDGANSNWYASDVVGSPEGVVAFTLIDQISPSVHAINALTGAPAWTKAATSETAMTFGHLILSSDASELDNFGKPCQILTGATVSQGTTQWKVDASSIHDAKGVCAGLRVHFAGEGDYPAARGGVVYVDVQDSGPYVASMEFRGFDVATGAARTIKGITTAFDPLTGDATLVADDGALTVYDTATGATVYSVAGPRAAALKLRVTGMYDGLLYTSTTDGTPVVDLATGKVLLLNATITPVGQVGAWTLYSDGLLSTDPHRFS